MRWKAILTGALLAGGCSGGSGANAPNDLATPHVLTPALLLSSSESGLEAAVVGTSFNFGQLRDLWVRVTTPSLARVAQEHLTFLNPLNELMYETTFAYSVDPGMQEMPMPGKQAPLVIYRAKPIPGGFALDCGLPLAGTNFTRFPTTAVGDWHVTAEVDGIARPLTTTMTVSFGR